GRIAVGEVVGELERADARLDLLRAALACRRHTAAGLYLLRMARICCAGDSEYPKHGRGGASQQRDGLATIGSHDTFILRLLRGNPLDVRQLPGLVEQRFFRTVETEQHLELSAWIR